MVCHVVLNVVFKREWIRTVGCKREVDLDTGSVLGDALEAILKCDIDYWTEDGRIDRKLHTGEEGETRLRTSTAEAHHNRKRQQDIDTTASLPAKLLSVPMPVGLSPAEATTAAPIVDDTDESDTPGAGDGS